MFDRLRRLFKSRSKPLLNEKYISVPESEFNEELKKRIANIEREAEKLSSFLQKEYSGEFAERGIPNLKIWVCRDIDGDEMDHLTSENCFEKEYRSLIAIDHSGPKIDDDICAGTIELWYYFGGYFKGKGSLYGLSKDEMEKDVEQTLQVLLEDMNSCNQ
ncbi:hypothetical protein ACTSEZ_09280 [Metabacillus sp. JX24]|uniref:hypothetical protein n=1 Tax=Metabacillus sp. JX24 TaxID=3240759 RepID=UPI00350EC51F